MMRRTFQVAAAGAITILAGAACSDDHKGGTAPNLPVYLGAAADSNPNNTVSSIVTVRAAGYDSAFVRFWLAGPDTTVTPAGGFALDSSARVPVLGLDTASSYTMEVNLVRIGEPVVAADTLTFASGSLPAWIPQMGVLGTDTTPGYLLLSLPDGGVAIDNGGRVVWYRYRPGGVLGSWSAQRNGLYSWLGATDSSGYYLYDNLGEEVGRVSCVGFKTRFHDVLIQQDGSAWIMCDDERVMDLTAVGGVNPATVTGTVIQHLDPAGQLLFEWNTFDHFQMTDLPLADRTGPSVNFTHGNAIDLDRDGNLIVSFRSLNEITKINSATGAIIWRFGGLNNQFTIVNDPKGSFERQHGVRVANPGELQFLDNGASIPSRFVRYLLNPVAGTATLVMAFIDSPTTFTNVGGGTQHYTNGNSIVSFGRAGRVVEVDPAGNRAWELTGVDGTYIFRVQRFGSLYSPGLHEPTR